MRMAIGADHGGFALKEALKQSLARRGVEVEDCGTFSPEAVDYPDVAQPVATLVSEGHADQGVLICRTGLGMSIAANRFPRVRAALCLTPAMARVARAHNDANVLVLAGDLTSRQEAEDILAAWLATPTDAAQRHRRRVAKTGHMGGSAIELAAVAETDAELYAALRGEEERELNTINLIASENYVSRAVREAQGSLLTNKYAEGYPGRRYYSGCEFADAAERLAIERAKDLFHAEHANVQPHSGSAANMAVYYAVLDPGDTMLAMSLAHGGHLTHGHKVNFSGRFFRVCAYGVSPSTERLDYEEMARLAREHRPKLIVAGASAYPRIIDFERLRHIADEVGAWLMVDMAHIAGLVAADCHPSPVPWSDFVTSTTHKTLRGPRSGLILCKARFAQEIDKQVFPGIQGGPLMHTVAAKAVCFQEARQPEFREYQRQTVRNAQVLAEHLAAQRLRIISGGTDNHLILADVTPLGLTGEEAATALEAAGIVVNKNAIPFDTRPPTVTSGIRLGTAAMTTRGFREAEMRQVGEWIMAALRQTRDEAALAGLRAEVTGFARRYPLP